MIKRRPKGKPESKNPTVFNVIPFGLSSSLLSPLPRGQYWLRQPGDNTQKDTLGATTLEPTVDVGGFKFNNAPARWVFAPADAQVITCSKLLRKFYNEARWWRKPKAWCRNPEKNGMSMYGDDKDIVLVLYGKNYHITIERNDMFGPHPARLFYRSQEIAKEIAWVAIVQLECMWHSDERMLKALNNEIRNRQLWQSEDTAKQIVLK